MTTKRTITITENDKGHWIISENDREVPELCHDEVLGVIASLLYTKWRIPPLKDIGPGMMKFNPD